LLRSMRISHSSFRDMGSRPVVGSSRKMRSAPEAMTMATRTLRFIPPERLRFSLLACSLIPTFSTESSARRFASLRSSPLHNRYDVIICTGDIHAIARASCGTTAIRSRSRLASAITSRPSMLAPPSLGSSRVERMRVSVVLPAPFLPMRAKIPEVGMRKLTDESALFPPL